jgi:hypothetical protein
MGAPSTVLRPPASRVGVLRTVDASTEVLLHQAIAECTAASTAIDLATEVVSGWEAIPYQLQDAMPEAFNPGRGLHEQDPCGMVCWQLIED